MFVIRASVELLQVAGQQRKCAVRALASRGRVSGSVRADVIDSESRHLGLG
jgi:hypothetical protein